MREVEIWPLIDILTCHRQNRGFLSKLAYGRYNAGECGPILSKGIKDKNITEEHWALQTNMQRQARYTLVFRSSTP